MLHNTLTKNGGINKKQCLFKRILSPMFIECHFVLKIYLRSQRMSWIFRTSWFNFIIILIEQYNHQMILYFSEIFQHVCTKYIFNDPNKSDMSFSGLSGYTNQLKISLFLELLLWRSQNIFVSFYLKSSTFLGL